MLKRHISISLRLTAWFGVIFLLGSLLFGGAMWLNLKQTLTAERRQTLDRRLDRMQDLLRASSMEPDADRMQDLRDFAHATGNGLDEVFRSDGQRLYAPSSAAAGAFPWPAHSSGAQESFVHVLSGGQPYWVLLRPFHSLRDGDLLLAAGAPESGNVLLLDHFAHGLLTAIPLVLLIASAGGYWISRRALRPVDRIIATTRSISIRNLSGRLPVSATNDELQRLTETCNDMLDRLDSAVKRLKRFTADASHELRAPLSLTRTVAEVALRNPALDDRSRAAFADILDESIKSAALLDQMLLLARADSAQGGIEMNAVDLAAIVREACASARRHATEKGLEVRLLPPEPRRIDVFGNGAHLSRLAWILLDNALKYTPAPGSIEVRLEADAQHARLQVSDTGAGIDAADLPYIFDRFYRADPSRSDVEGSGLGLSIALWIAELHRAEISVESTRSAGSTFIVSFPAHPSLA